MEQKRKVAITVFCMAAMFLFAISCTLIGNLLPNVIGEFDITLSRAGIVTVAQNFGGIIALIFCGFLADRFGKLKVILTIFFMMVLFLCDCFVIQRFRSFVIAAMVIGLASSSLNMLISAYLSDLYPKKSNFYINMGGVFFGIGSVMAPIYLQLMSQFRANWRVDFGVCGIVSLVTIVFFLVILFLISETEKKGALENSNLQVKEIISDLKQPMLILFSAMGFLYMAHSSSVMNWMPTYLANRFQYQEAINNNIMAVYWIGILGSRLMMTFFAGKVKPKYYLIFGNALGGFAMIGIVISEGIVLLAAFFFLGLATGAIFQIILALTCQTFPKFSGTASSLVALSGSVGGTLCCWIIGIVADDLGFPAAIIIQTVVLIFIVPLALFGLKRKHEVFIGKV
ncbi:MAG: MFS transporter [Eubacteriales bacterium]|nr:MFS transporter [Eubacteriales bacterium]